MKSKKMKIVATHSGFVNGNYFMYLPDGMSSGVNSFISPYNKPITNGHYSWYDSEKDVPVIGRVVEANYVSYDNEAAKKLSDVNIRFDNIHEIAQEIYEKYQKDNPLYTGSGHVEVNGDFQGESILDELSSNRYKTVSIGSAISVAKCSICGTAISSSGQTCEHDRGSYYDGKLAFWIGGQMKFDHLAFVKRPADPNAQTVSFGVEDSIGGTVIYVEDSTELKEERTKLTLKEKILDKYNEFVDSNTFNIKNELLDSHKALREKGKSHSYLFDKNIYLKDKIGVALALKAIQSLDDVGDEEKSELEGYVAIIDSILSVGKLLDISDEGYLDKFLLSVDVVQPKPETETQEAVSQDKVAQEDDTVNTNDNSQDQNKIDTRIEIDYDLLSTMIADKMSTKKEPSKDSVISFLKQRVSILEKALDEVQAELDKTEHNDSIEDSHEAKDLEKINLEQVSARVVEDSKGNDDQEKRVVTANDLESFKNDYKRILSEKGLVEAKKFFEDNKNKYIL